jgi:hypothetical protein
MNSFFYIEIQLLIYLIDEENTCMANDFHPNHTDITEEMWAASRDVSQNRAFRARSSAFCVNVGRRAAFHRTIDYISNGLNLSRVRRGILLCLVLASAQRPEPGQVCMGTACYERIRGHHRIESHYQVQQGSVRRPSVCPGTGRCPGLAAWRRSWWCHDTFGNVKATRLSKSSTSTSKQTPSDTRGAA